MISLLLAALFFIGIHLGVSGSRMRDELVGRYGLRAYMIGFSVGSVAGMIWLVNAYQVASYVPLWGMAGWWKVIAIVLMLPAFVLVVAGLATPNPTAVGQEGLVANPALGIVRVTRHPFLMGAALWAFVHLVSNGDLASVTFFGALLIVAAAGAPSIDAKRRRAVGAAAWDGFAAQTSVIPFAAILSGRNRLVAGELGWWKIGLGALLYVLMLGGHRHIVGVSPFPW